MAVNRVSINGTTVIDLTADTVTPETLSMGVTAHNAAGELITGTHIEPVTYYTGEDEPSSDLGNDGDIYLQNPPEV